MRFPGATLPDGLAAWLMRRSEGNPLFMIHVADALGAPHGVAVYEEGSWTLRPDWERVGVPDSVRGGARRPARRLEPSRPARGVRPAQRAGGRSRPLAYLVSRA
jgi:hypothetical protein